MLATLKRHGNLARLEKSRIEAIKRLTILARETVCRFRQNLAWQMCCGLEKRFERSQCQSTTFSSLMRSKPPELRPLGRCSIPAPLPYERTTNGMQQRPTFAQSRGRRNSNLFPTKPLSAELSRLISFVDERHQSELKALGMMRKLSSFRPEEGFILETSLGWLTTSRSFMEKPSFSGKSNREKGPRTLWFY